MNSIKKEKRKDFKKVIASLDERWVKAASKELCGNLTSLFDKELSSDLTHILAWKSFFSGEPDLSGLILDQIEKHTVYLPRTYEDYSMKFISIGNDWISQIEPGHFGIPEPKTHSGNLYDPAVCKQSIVLVPGVAFDREGNRVGRGKGCYDRFLSNPDLKGILKIGIAWSLQIVDALPVDNYDVAMDWICHEEGYIKTRFGSVDDML